MSCYCHTCKAYFQSLGIARHRAAHRDRHEVCVITYKNCDTYTHDFRVKEPKIKWIIKQGENV